ncbi:MAG: PQQ-binding-like beta-propeller repeat protein [Candidatus Bathyarchaeota archaeon]|nr:PQQ-binding-like beta-propeller repeat protein [Candidatus Bathyarchaeota archaeon]
MQSNKTLTIFVISLLVLSSAAGLFKVEPAAAVNTMNGTIVFHETGLASGTSWTVNIQGTNHTVTSTYYSTSWLRDLPCPWTVYVPAGYTTTSTLSGTAYVSAMQTRDIYVDFTASAPPAYDVVFTESGLPEGTFWTVTLNGTTTGSITPTNVFEDIPNGVYDYVIDVPTGYDASVTSGTITVDGANAYQSVAFVAQQGTWWMMGNGLGHTGYSSSMGPLTSNLLWSKNTWDLEGLRSTFLTSPVIANGVLYFGGSSTIFALNPANGSLIRTYSLGSSWISSSSASPAIVNDILYVGTGDGKVIALNVTSGDTIWNYTTGSGISSSPAITNGVLYVGSVDDNLYALNATTGTLLWSFTTGGNVNSSPAVSKGLVFFGSEDGKLYALNAQTGVQVWNYSATGNYNNAAPCVENGIVYASIYSSSTSGSVFALNATTGQEIWTVSKTAYCPVTVANGIAYFTATNDGYSYALNATTGAQIWTYQTNAYRMAPMVAYDVVYFQGSSTLQALNATTGEAIWNYNIRNYMSYGSPIIANGIIYTVSADIMRYSSIYAFGTLDQHSLTMTTEGNGTVQPGNQTYYAGTNVDLVAIPDAGWSFSGWSGDASGESNTTLTMDSNKTVTATFTQDNYTLTMTTIGEGSVLPGNQSYLSGTSVDIQAINGTGWAFSGWSGDSTDSTNTTIRMDSNKTVTATFVRDSYNLTAQVYISGDLQSTRVWTYSVNSEKNLTAEYLGLPASLTLEHWDLNGAIGYNSSVTVIMNQDYTIKAYAIPTTFQLILSSVNGTTTPENGTTTYTYGDIANVTATPNAGYSFSYWLLDGEVNSTDSTFQLQMLANHTLSAVFNQNSYTLTIHTVGQGTVLPGNRTYVYGEEVDLQAINMQDWRFSGWSGDASGTSNTSITMNANKTVTATFTPNNFTLTIITIGQGTVEGGNRTYTYGTNVTLTAQDGVGWTFKEWTGDLSGSENIGYILIDGNKTVTATFTQNVYYIDFDVVGNGTVIRNATGAYLYGQTVNFTAVPDAGWSFTEWRGAKFHSTDNPLIMTIDSNRTITVTFTQDTYTLTVITSGNGTVSPGNSSYLSGTIVNLTAIADQGWTFSGWGGAASGTTNTTLTLTGNLTVTATFTQDNYLLTIITTGQGSVTNANATFLSGTTVDLSATGSTGWHFVNWTGNLSGSTNPTSILLDGNKTVIATFERDVCILTMKTDGEGSVLPGNATYYYGDSVDLKAIANEGWSFANWTGSASGTTNTTLTMTGNFTVIATFTHNSHSLTMTTVGQGSVTPGNQTYLYGTDVDLEAIAASGWAFNGWSGDASGEATTSITISRNMTVTANFVRLYNLGVTVYLDGEQLSYKDYDCKDGTRRETNFESALPPEWTFDHLVIDGEIQTGTSYSILMNQNHTLDIYITTTQVQLNIIDALGGATNPAYGNYTYDYGTELNITATPRPGYLLANWTIGTTTNTNQTLTLTLTENMTITPVFAIDPNYVFNVTFTQTGLPSGTNWSVTLNGQTITSTNETITFEVHMGDYNYTITLPDGFTSVVPLSGTFSTEVETAEIEIETEYVFIFYIPIIRLANEATQTTDTSTPTETPTPTLTPTPTPTVTPTPTTQPTTTPTQQQTQTNSLVLPLVVAIIILGIVLYGLYTRRGKLTPAN